MESKHNYEQDEEEDVSLCDFPLNLIKDGNQTPASSTNKDAQITETQAVEEFDFGSVGGGSLLTGSEMCAAEDVFFQGQLLPLRLSISSDNGLTNFRGDSSRNASRCLSRSESMDHGSLGGFRSISSGSCSTSSISSNSNSAATTITRVTSNSEPSRLVVRNQFHSHPSPKPQIRASSSRLERTKSRNQQHHQKSSTSSLWDFFRVGLVRTPDIELQELNYKVLRSNSSRANCKGSVSRNSSVSSSDNNNKNSNSNGGKVEAVANNVAEKQKRQRYFLSGCKCSAEAVASNAIIMKNGSCSDQSNGSNNNVNDNGGVKTTTTSRAVKESKMMNNKKKQKQKAQQQQQQGKQDLSHHRTYEWLKELSHANFPMYV